MTSEHGSWVAGACSQNRSFRRFSLVLLERDRPSASACYPILKSPNFRLCEAKAVLIEAENTAARKTLANSSLRTRLVRSFPENVNLVRRYELPPGTRASLMPKSQRALLQSVGFSSVCDTFDEMADREWRSRDGCFHRALGFVKMSTMRGDKEGVSIAHCSALKIGALAHLPIATSLLMAYSRAADPSAPLALFDETPYKDVITWNTMTTSLADNQWFGRALDLFAKMMEGGSGFDSTSLLIFSSIFMRTSQLIQGRIVHSLSMKSGMRSNYSLCNALMDMYAKCGDLSSSESIFASVGYRDVIAWNSLLSGCLHNNNHRRCLHYFKERALYDKMGEDAMLLTEGKILYGYNTHRGMGLDPRNKAAKEAVELFGHLGFEYDEITIVNILSGCTQLGIMRLGTQIHSRVFRLGFHEYSFISAAVVDMYSNCGRLDVALQVFRNSPKKSIAAWNSMISAHGYHGDGKKAMKLFEKMHESGIRATKITFVSPLSACSHAGLVKEGKLFEASELIKKMKTRPKLGIWDPLLTSCNYHGNVEIGREVAELLFDLEPENSGYYIALSNMYTAAGGWIDAVTLHELIQEKGLRKPIGYSHVEFG
ncbi:hypothetical protein ACJRO7_018997 [Eucalyptus globulus]|uniref:Pentatricopeptide repeat-containing protein n=1 Tax=Eucalyptus globulus TaxID=34317 RepID=A0ABD3KWN4_EUCGL